MAEDQQEHSASTGRQLDPVTVGRRQESRAQRMVTEQAPSGDWHARELLATLGAVVFADLMLYRGRGYAGVAAFLIAGTLILLFGKARPRRRLGSWIVAAMLALLSARLLWHGSPPQVLAGFLLVIVLSTVLEGYKPYFMAVLLTASQTVVAGYRAAWEYLQSVRCLAPRIARRRYLNVVLPVAALLAFSTIFVLANPDIATFVSGQLERTIKSISEWLIQAAFRPTELLFWIAVAWISAGLLRPQLPAVPSQPVAQHEEKLVESPLYAACRNTLVTLIGLFAVYLAYEFTALWRRDFPVGFYYAGYAHQGAAWLTVALAMATLILSFVFSGANRRDPRLARLRSLAAIWWLQNLLLALAVYNRLFIYIDFNGMTRMRVIGLAGTTTVVFGFLLVLAKTLRGESFLWLVRRQVWALAIAIYFLILLPLDGMAAAYNVRQVQQGQLSASMQLGVHHLDVEGIMALRPLLDHRHAEIREGVEALIADRYLLLKAQAARRQRAGWTAYQISDRVALDRFAALRPRWKHFEDDGIRAAAIRGFHIFAYQWY